MSLKRRITLANIAMVLIPVAVTALVGLACALVLWLVLFPGQGLEESVQLLEDALIAQVGAHLGRHQLKLVLGAACAVVLVAVLASCSAANRIASRLVTERIERQLAELERGLGRLASGDLAYRIEAAADEEFKPAMADFNELAETSERNARAVERQDAERRQLIADISHDLRSPLTAVRGYAEALRDGVVADPERQARYLRVICNKADQMDMLVEGLFEYSKLEASGYPVALEPLDAAALVRELAASYAGSREGLVEAECETGPAPALTLADRRLLERCLANLLDNAAKYREGEVARVRLGVAGRDGGYVISVADDGPGVPAEDLERIFDPFFRGDVAREHPENGSGMGLAFVRRAMALMGGSARARANEPQGLVVELLLQAAAVGPEAEGAAAEAPALAAEAEGDAASQASEAGEA